MGLPGPVAEGGLEFGWRTGVGLLVVFCGALGAAERQEGGEQESEALGPPTCFRQPWSTVICFADWAPEESFMG